MSVFRGYYNNVIFQTVAVILFGIGCVIAWKKRQRDAHPKAHGPLTLFVVGARFALAAVSRTICSGFRCGYFDAGDRGVESFLLADLAVS